MFNKQQRGNSSLIICALIVLFGIISTGAFATNEMETDDNKTQYFARISGVISPFLPYKPVLPLRKEETHNISHYKVTYDAQARINVIAYYRGDRPSDRAYFGTHKVKFIYGATGYSRKYFDAQAQPANMWRHYYQGGEIHEERYVMKGNTLEMRLFNAQGKAIESDIGAHLFVKTPVTENKYYQVQFNLANEPVVFRNAMPFMHTTITTGKDGFLHLTNNVDPVTLLPKDNAEAGYATLEVTFDENGIEEGWEYRNQEGNLVELDRDSGEEGIAKWVYFADWRDRSRALQRVLVVKKYNAKGKEVASSDGIYRTEYYFDINGYHAGAGFYDREGNLLYNKDSDYAELKIINNLTGQRLEERYYDADGSLRGQPFAVKRYSYSDDGELLNTQELNASEVEK